MEQKKKQGKKKNIYKKIPCCEWILLFLWIIVTKDEHTYPCGNKLTRLFQKNTFLSTQINNGFPKQLQQLKG